MDNIEKLTFSLPEAMRASGFSRSSIYRDIAAGRLVARKRGTRLVFLSDDLKSWLSNLPKATITQAAA